MTPGQTTANRSIVQTTPATAPGAPRPAPIGPHRGFGYYANAFMLWIGLHFLWVGYIFVWFAALYFFLCVPKARRASIRYLELIHVEKPRGFLRRNWQTYRHMVTFGILLLDRALMLARPGHGFSTRTAKASRKPRLARRRREAPALRRFRHRHHPPHRPLPGMAETAAPTSPGAWALHKPMHIVMYQDPRDGTERFHARHRRMLEKVSIISTIDPLAAGVKIISALRKGDFVAMRADRTLSGKGVEVSLLGKELLLPAGPFVAATLSNAQVLYIHTCRLGYRRYRCIISAARRTEAGTTIPRDQRIAQAAQEFATHLETVLRRYPYQWSNFYDLWQAPVAGSLNHFVLSVRNLIASGQACSIAFSFGRWIAWCMCPGEAVPGTLINIRLLHTIFSSFFIVASVVGTVEEMRLSFPP